MHVLARNQIDREKSIKSSCRFLATSGSKVPCSMKSSSGKIFFISLFDLLVSGLDSADCFGKIKFDILRLDTV